MIRNGRKFSNGVACSHVQIEKAPNELGDVTKIVPAQVLKVFLVLATCTKIQQEGDKLQETLPNEREQRLADLQASQKFQ